MKVFGALFRVVITLGASFLGILGVMILFTPGLMESGSDLYIILGITASSIGIGITGLMARRISNRMWFKIGLSMVLGIMSIVFFVIAFEKGFRLRFFVTALYMVFLSACNLYFTLETKLDPERQSAWVAAFVLFTMVEVTLGFMQNIVHAAIALIALLSLFTIFGAPFFARQRLALLFAGEHAKLRKRLSPKALAYDRILLAYSHLYCGELKEALQVVDAFESALIKKSKRVPYFEYMCHAIVIECLFHSEGIDAQQRDAIKSRFEQMKTLNAQLFKRGYPMSMPFQIVYVLGLYEDKDTFRSVMKDAVDFEQGYDFKRQSESFYKQHHIDGLLMKAEVLKADHQWTAAKPLYEEVIAQAVQPLHTARAEKALKEAS